MKRTVVIILVLILGMFHAATGQDIREELLEYMDTVLICLPEYTGELYWEYSMDGTTWDTIPGQPDTLFGPVASDSYFRGKVVAGFCPPYYTETLFLNVNVILPPVVITAEVTEITETGAVSGGNVSNDGGDIVTSRGVCWSISYPPTIEDDKTEDGSDIGSYISTLTGLYPGTTYWVSAYATNSTGTGYGEAISFTTSGDPLLFDIDGNSYQTVQIGEQIWMTENLKVTHYADGTPIPLLEDAVGWDSLRAADRAYCWYANSTGNKDLYGALYTWAAAMNGAWGDGDNQYGVQGVCPDGWHLPGDAEWKTLETFLGMSSADVEGTHWRGTDEGGKLKEQGTTYWQSPNEGATNETGFTALPAGIRNPYGGGFFGMDQTTIYWTASEHFLGISAWCRALSSEYTSVYRKDRDMEQGFSVRCVKGERRALPPQMKWGYDNVTDIYETFASTRGYVYRDNGAEVTARGACWSTSPAPTIDNDTTINGKGIGVFHSTMTNLSPGTTYYVRTYATNTAGTGYSTEFSFTTADSGSTVTDFDGNAYYTVQIGEQVWMAENLRTSHLADGTPIPLVENAAAWDSLGEADKAYCWYDNNAENSDPYGGLYTWNTAMDGCPTGWHLPSEAEWDTLINFLGGEEVAGGKLKEKLNPNRNWSFPNTGATNESGFTALGGGQRTYRGTFKDLSKDGNYWTSTSYSSSNASYRKLFYDKESTTLGGSQTNTGCSVRCVKD